MRWRDLPAPGAYRLHGHSRGAAVVMEAAAQRPDLYAGAGRRVEAVLEAPVLPWAGNSRVARWLASWPARVLGAPGLAVLRRVPVECYGLWLYGPLRGYKPDLPNENPHNPNSAETLLRNLRSLDEWARRRGYEVFAGRGRGWIVMAGNERLLDRTAQWASARHAGAQWQVIEIPGASHVISLDRPDLVCPGL